MVSRILVGIVAGVACAVIYISASSGLNWAGAALLMVATLPCFIAGLGWGVTASVTAALTAAGIVANVFGGMGGLDVLLTQTLPAVILAHLVMLGRPVGDQDPRTGGGMEWYPIGRVLAAATLLAAGASMWRLFNLGSDADAIRRRVSELFTRVFQGPMPGLDGRSLSPQQIENLAQAMTLILPAALAAMWLIGTLFNLWLAGRITRASGRLARPWPDLPSISLPQGFGIGLALSVAIGWAGGTIGFFGSTVAGAFLTAYTLLGLAVIHWNARVSPWRAMILAGTYASLLILSVWAAFAIALVGLAEPFAPWSRSRNVGRPPPGAGS